MRKLASSPTIEGAEKLLNQYFYSTSYKISEDLKVSNNKGIYEKVIIKKLKGRYVIYEK